MSLASTTGTILKAAYPQGDPNVDWIVSDTPTGLEINEWNLAGETQPTEQQINDWATDTVALPSGQLFSEWLAENGGDDTLTRRRQAREAADETTPVGVRVRALIELLNKRDNYLTNRIAELQDALDAVKASTGPADNIRAAIPSSWLPTNTRPRNDAIQDYKDDIAAGNQDT